MMTYQQLTEKLHHLQTLIGYVDYAGHPIYRIGLNSIDPDITLPDSKHLTDDTLKQYAVGLANKSLLDRYNLTLKTLLEEMSEDVSRYRKMLMETADKVKEKNFDVFPSQEAIRLILGVDKTEIMPVLETLVESVASLYGMPKVTAIEEMFTISYNSYLNLERHLPTLISLLQSIVTDIDSFLSLEDGSVLIDAVQGKLLTSIDKLKDAVKEALVDDSDRKAYWFRRVYHSYRHGFLFENGSIKPSLVRFDRDYGIGDDVDMDSVYETIVTVTKQYQLPDDPTDPNYLPLNPSSLIEDCLATSMSIVSVHKKLGEKLVATDTDSMEDSGVVKSVLENTIIVTESVKIAMDVLKASTDRQTSIRAMLDTIAHMVG